MTISLNTVNLLVVNDHRRDGCDGLTFRVKKKKIPTQIENADLFRDISRERFLYSNDYLFDYLFDVSSQNDHASIINIDQYVLFEKSRITILLTIIYVHTN